MDAQEFADLRVGDNLDKTFTRPFDGRLAVRLETEPPYLHVMPAFFGLPLGEPHRGHLRNTERGPRHRIVVERMRSLAGDGLDGRNRLIAGDMGQAERRLSCED